MDKILICGGSGLVGSSVIRYLKSNNFNLQILSPTHSELDLTIQSDVDNFFKQEKPEYIVLAAALVGGIIRNSLYGGDFIRNNLIIQSNVIEAARKYGCKRFCFLGSSCIYPRDCLQPIKEEYLLTGPLELTNKPYAIAKIAGVETINAYRKQYNFPGYSLMPTNMYGLNDNFNLQNSHVFPALLRKFHEAKINKSNCVEVWGSGNVKREFMFVDDLAEVIATTLLNQNLSVPELMNVGYGQDLYIHELASMIREVVGFSGEIRYDRSKPDGTPQKLLDVSKMMSLELRAKTPLKKGIELTYEWFKENYKLICDKELSAKSKK